MHTQCYYISDKNTVSIQFNDCSKKEKIFEMIVNKLDIVTAILYIC